MKDTVPLAGKGYQKRPHRSNISPLEVGHGITKTTSRGSFYVQVVNAARINLKCAEMYQSEKRSDAPYSCQVNSATWERRKGELKHTSRMVSVSKYSNMIPGILFDLKPKGSETFPGISVELTLIERHFLKSKSNSMGVLIRHMVILSS